MNDQEKLWAGEFGNAYHERNALQYRLEFWLNVLRKVNDQPIQSVLEVGAGKGDNLRTLQTLYPEARYAAIEINVKACEAMRDLGITVFNCPSTTLNTVNPKQDLVISRGFLIHVPEQDLGATLRLLFTSSARYIFIGEYFSPERREIMYRGYPNALWADDYAGRMMAMYPGKLAIVDTGFAYSGNGGDDITWFLLEKTK